MLVSSKIRETRSREREREREREMGRGTRLIEANRNEAIKKKRGERRIDYAYDEKQYVEPARINGNHRCGMRSH